MLALYSHSSQQSKVSSALLKSLFSVILSLVSLSSQTSSEPPSLLPLLIQPHSKTKQALVCIQHSRASLPHPSLLRRDLCGWMLAPLWRMQLELETPNLQESSWTQRCQPLKITLKRKVRKENSNSALQQKWYCAVTVAQTRRGTGFQALLTLYLFFQKFLSNGCIESILSSWCISQVW